MESSFVVSGNENNQRENNQNKNVGKRKGGSQKRSWVWEWFISTNKGEAICQVEVINGQLCNKCYQHGSSTGVLIDHLAKTHQITKGMIKQDYVVRNKLYSNIFFKSIINNL
jgi:hypothetical protein